MRHKSIWIRTEFVGFHRWINAPLHRLYLSAAHRHLFKIEVRVSVVASDREIEFHDLKNLTDLVIKEKFVPLRKNPFAAEDDNDEVAQGPEIIVCTMSCEAIAEKIMNELYDRGIITVESVSVSEDGECGATVSRSEV